MTRRAVILTGKLVQDHEYTYPYYRLQEEGYEVDVAVRGKETVLGIIGVKVRANQRYT
ncbi:MAG: DJ-1/PfpI family protein [Dehalococcoidales bacterium]|nr:DJ-1/PfpI family protein [Dehalococcoidales bacterium]